MASLREEVKEMRQMLLASTSQKSSRAVDHVTTAAKTNHEDGAAPVVGCTHTESVIDSDNQLVPSAAQRLQAAIKSGAIVKTARAPRKLIVGKSTNNTKVQSVNTTRVIDIFVSRLHPSTSVSDIEDCVKAIQEEGKLSVHEIRCVKLKSRYEDLYMSAHVEVRVSAADMKSALDLFMSNEPWPTGVFVRRYFKPKHQDVRA